MMLDRRLVLGGGAALIAAPALARGPRTSVWRFDNLSRIGSRPVTVAGAPKTVTSPWGPALAFDGVGDGLFIDQHPLAGARAFTVEALFRPDGGAFEQRWLNLESVDRPDLAPGTGITRLLFEIRVTGDRWYLDAFVTGPGYKSTLAVPDKTHPIGPWYHVAQTCDGRHFRSYVNGELQAESEIAFAPQGPGRASVGVRLNRVNWFHGAIREARFTPAVVPTAGFRLPG
jgi:hypothetical protein